MTINLPPCLCFSASDNWKADEKSCPLFCLALCFVHANLVIIAFIIANISKIVIRVLKLVLNLIAHIWNCIFFCTVKSLDDCKILHIIYVKISLEMRISMMVDDDLNHLSGDGDTRYPFNPLNWLNPNWIHSKCWKVGSKSY